MPTMNGMDQNPIAIHRSSLPLRLLEHWTGLDAAASVGDVPVGRAWVGVLHWRNVPGG